MIGLMISTRVNFFRKGAAADCLSLEGRNLLCIVAILMLCNVIVRHKCARYGYYTWASPSLTGVDGMSLFNHICLASIRNIGAVRGGPSGDFVWAREVSGDVRLCGVLDAFLPPAEGRVRVETGGGEAVRRDGGAPLPRRGARLGRGGDRLASSAEVLAASPAPPFLATRSIRSFPRPGISSGLPRARRRSGSLRRGFRAFRCRTSSLRAAERRRFRGSPVRG